MLVNEAHGVLSVMVLLPPEFNETYAFYRGADYFGTGYDEQFRSSGRVVQTAGYSLYELAACREHPGGIHG